MVKIVELGTKSYHNHTVRAIGRLERVCIQAGLRIMSPRLRKAAARVDSHVYNDKRDVGELFCRLIYVGHFTEINLPNTPIGH